MKLLNTWKKKLTYKRLIRVVIKMIKSEIYIYKKKTIIGNNSPGRTQTNNLYVDGHEQKMNAVTRMDPETRQS